MALHTETIRFDVFVSENTPESQSRMGSIVEGAGEILVTPAPGAIAVLLPAALGALRRARSRD